MPKKSQDNQSVGEDSFLDTTANLVGILIILVVVVGAKTRVEAEQYGQQLAQEEDSSSIENGKAQARAIESQLAKRTIELKQYVAETAYRSAERKQLMLKVAMAKEKVDERLSELKEEEQQQIEKAIKRDRLRSQLSDLEEESGAAEAEERPTVILEHLPTPMAKTVFHREMHVRLKDGRLSIVPWDRLVETLKKQIPLAMSRKRSRPVLEDSLGPVGGYIMRYRLVAVPGGMELDKFELEAAQNLVEEPLSEALSATGRFRLELLSRRASETVVTVWVYPDSFEEFRELKATLFEDGYLCAARPLPDHIRIGASPQGTRSSAQ